MSKFEGYIASVDPCGPGGGINAVIIGKRLPDGSIQIMNTIDSTDEDYDEQLEKLKKHTNEDESE